MDEELFIKSIVLRLTDTAKQNWNTEINNRRKLSLYREFQFTQFAVFNHQLMAEGGTYCGIDFADRRCIHCDISCIENECHFLLE